MSPAGAPGPEAVRLEFGRVLPMLAETATAPFDDPDWVFEAKWDGYRALAFLTRGGTLLQSRRLRNLTPDYPELGGLHERLSGNSAVVDGEIVALRNGRPDFQTLQGRGHPVVYVVFDLLELNGRSHLGAPLIERKASLAACLEGGLEVAHSDGVVGQGVMFHRAAVEQGLEGSMAKRLASRYSPGRRTRDWLKLRNVHRLFALVVGHTRAADARPLGSLLLGVYNGEGELIYAGHAGTGFTQDEGRRLVELAGPARDCPLAGGYPRDLRGRATWVEPRRVVEIEYLELTRDGRLRHPVYRGLRPDKDASDCLAPGVTNP